MLNEASFLHPSTSITVETHKLRLQEMGVIMSSDSECFEFTEQHQTSSQFEFKSKSWQLVCACRQVISYLDDVVIPTSI